MPEYLVQASSTNEGAKGLLKEGGTSRLPGQYPFALRLVLLRNQAGVIPVCLP